MGYLDNGSITVDAVLTKKGREILKDGNNLNITSFTVGDTGVDYTLWNPDHPSGSAFYGEAIENLPMLEASVHAEYNLRNRLISLNQNTVAIPALVLNGLDKPGGSLLTLNEEADMVKVITTNLVGFTSTLNIGMYLVVQDPSLISITGASQVSNLSGTSRQFLQEQDIPHAQEYQIANKTFNIAPIMQDTTGKSTNVYVVDSETGAYNSFTVINNVLKNPRIVLNTVRSS